MSRPVVHIVDDDASVRTALSRVLRYAGFEARGYASAVDFLVAERHDGPSCIVLDVGLPGMSGVELQTVIGGKEDTPPIVFLTGRGDVDTSVRAMKAGAVDFLTKPVKRSALLAAVDAALARDERRRLCCERNRLVRERFGRLTPREREVFWEVVHGRLNRQIAEAFGTSIRTVKAQRAQVMAKMEAGSLAELISIAGRLETPRLLPNERRGWAAAADP